MEEIFNVSLIWRPKKQFVLCSNLSFLLIFKKKVISLPAWISFKWSCVSLSFSMYGIGLNLFRSYLINRYQYNIISTTNPSPFIWEISVHRHMDQYLILCCTFCILILLMMLSVEMPLRITSMQMALSCINPKDILKQTSCFMNRRLSAKMDYC